MQTFVDFFTYYVLNLKKIEVTNLELLGWSRVLLNKLIFNNLVKKFLTYDENLKDKI
jgi:hypothetical protein